MECIHVKSLIIQLVDSLSVFNKYIKGLTLIPVLTMKLSKKIKHIYAIKLKYNKLNNLTYITIILVLIFSFKFVT